MRHLLLLMAAVVMCTGDSTAQPDRAPSTPYDPTAAILEQVAEMEVGPLDWPQWGGSGHRNNTPHGENLPTHWDVKTGENILWSVPIGAWSYGALAVANGRIFIGMNNNHGYVARYPSNIDLGCLNCFDARTGEFLWQHSNLKLPSGRVHDYPTLGVCSIPYCNGDRLWYVNNRGCVMCLDADGFRDGENDGPFLDEVNENLDEADVIWELDMIKELGVVPHQASCCSCTAWRDVLFVNTGNSATFSADILAPDAPSFIAMHLHTGEVLWTDNSPGLNILHGQWCSPATAELGSVPQVLFGGGDGWLYSFAVEGDGAGNAELLWKFDVNPKESQFVLGGRGTRNHMMGCPVVYDGRVYIAVGDDPEHGEGNGHLWCIDPTRRGDVSPELAVDADGNVIPPRRLQAVIPENGERAIPNPNSAMVWHYDGFDLNQDGELGWEEQMHRALGTSVIKNDLLFIGDLGGLLHCLDAKTGQALWTYELFSTAWGTPMIVDGKVYVCDEEGDVAVFELSREMNLLAENYMFQSIYTTPVVANNILYLCNNKALFAIAEE
jgi:outer membrane protein assembly factor BamB